MFCKCSRIPTAASSAGHLPSNSFGPAPVHTQRLALNNMLTIDRYANAGEEKNIMHESKLEFAKAIRIRSEQFEDRAEAFFGDGSLRAELTEFWQRNGEKIESYAQQFWHGAVEDIHVDTMTALFGQPITREAVVAMSAQTTTMIFTATKETDWMKNFARLGLASWLVDREEQMVETLTQFSHGLIEMLLRDSEHVSDAIADVLFIHRITMVQAEIVASFRAKLEARHTESAINRLGNDFVSSLSGKIDTSLEDSRSLNAEATDASEKIAGLRSDTTEAAAISHQSAQSMQEAAQTAGALLTALNNIQNSISDGQATFAEAATQVQKTATDNTIVVDQVAAIEGVLNTISQIASQTNILALNASIEAARAGASGAGFAVVAQEVKNLANQTSRATETVAEQIAAIQGSSSESQRSSNDMVETIARLQSESSRLLTSLDRELGEFSKITDAVDETAQGAANIGDLVANIDRDTEALSNLIERLTRASRDSAGKLSDLVDETGDFVSRLGAH